ncbi:MAG TPA: hypothetical protein VGD21_09025 [Lysobacter sp.]
MSDEHSHYLEAFDAMVPVIIETVPQEDILSAFTCYIGPMISRAENPDEIRTAVDEILHHYGVPTPGL